MPEVTSQFIVEIRIEPWTSNLTVHSLRYYATLAFSLECQTLASLNFQVLQPCSMHPDILNFHHMVFNGVYSQTSMHRG